MATVFKKTQRAVAGFDHIGGARLAPPVAPLRHPLSLPLDNLCIRRDRPSHHMLAATFTAKFRDGEDIVREVATGCRDKEAALSRLRELIQRADRVRGGIIRSPSGHALAASGSLPRPASQSVAAEVGQR